ncbi:hypothetical protein ACMBCN_01590 [Candidatus Liberibacter asiaticus]
MGKETTSNQFVAFRSRVFAVIEFSSFLITSLECMLNYICL